MTIIEIKAALYDQIFLQSQAQQNINQLTQLLQETLRKEMDEKQAETNVVEPGDIHA